MQPTLLSTPAGACLMPCSDVLTGLRRRAACGLLALLTAATGAQPVAAPATAGASGPAVTRLRVVGGLADVNQYTRHEQPFWTQTLPALTQGQLQAEIVPFDRAGIRGQSMLRLLQLGVVPFGTVLLNLSNADDPLLAAPALPGLFFDLPALRQALAMFRPVLQQRLRERHGIELLAVYAYPAQMLFCRRPMAGLDDLAGRRVRVSSVTQADLMAALGAQPVYTEFADLLPQVAAGTVDCAITGSMSGNTIGLHTISSHLYALPINWGLSFFAANAAAWAALPAPLQLLLRQHLPQLEQAIWSEAERETGDGVACNTGAASCKGGQRGRMALVQATPADRQRLRQLVQQQVLPRWVKRCGQDCAAVWNSTLGQAAGLPTAAH